MLVSKATLAKIIKTIDDFDAPGSPYVGLQWGQDAPLFHRSGPAGFIQSVGYQDKAPDMVVSISHLKTVLGKFLDDEVDMSADHSGVLVLRNLHADGEMGIKLHVHTLRQSIIWAKRHDPGPRSVALDPAGFQGINISPFDLITMPVLRQKKMMLATNQGVVMRSEVPVEAYPYPRDVFLRTLLPLEVKALSLSLNGYWCAEAGGFEVVIAGHRHGDQLFDLSNRGAERLAELPAGRLTYALQQAYSIASKSANITVDPEQGLLFTDCFGNQDRIGLGTSSGWSRFVISAGVAEMLTHALKQSTDEVAYLERVDQENMRITRGLWSVTFRAFQESRK